jgi:hypothetical protein
MRCSSGLPGPASDNPALCEPDRQTLATAVGESIGRRTRRLPFPSSLLSFQCGQFADTDRSDRCLALLPLRPASMLISTESPSTLKGSMPDRRASGAYFRPLLPATVNQPRSGNRCFGVVHAEIEGDGVVIEIVCEALGDFSRRGRHSTNCSASSRKLSPS